MTKRTREEIIQLVKYKELSNNFTLIIPKTTLVKYKELTWGNNGVGSRWARKIFNYTVIENKKTKTYSENEDEKINEIEIKKFQENNKGVGIIGIMVHSIRINDNSERPINKNYNDYYKNLPCVTCGSNSDLIVDHKNDLYNNELVLNTKTQKKEDFQTLCNHCNLQKRQICKKEKETNKIYSGLNIPMFEVFKDEPFVNNNKFDWENENLDIKDKDSKKTSFWYDPVQFVINIKNMYTTKIKSQEEEINRLKEELNKFKDNNITNILDKLTKLTI